MKFRTEYRAVRNELTLNPENPIVLMGSCFSQNMAAKMEESGWDAVIAGGTLYNPLSIGIALSMMLDETNGEDKFKNTLFYASGLWNSQMFDSSFSAKSREDCIEEFRLRSSLLREALKKGETLIVTFGTSICYFLAESKEPVGNCHKQPADLFTRRRLSIEEIAGYWNSLLSALKERFPGLQVIFTVSPVRHLKDGFEGNARSKAILHLAIEEICGNYGFCHYFPAYEILTDDLRDYRFYAGDLVHPSEEAVEYIWEIFKESFIDENGRRYLEAGFKATRARQHRPKTGALGRLLS
ncbi:MAG: GSCFA domain-containing protein [Muribaculaceae bacterium]|nr:GSCFA domain-containing protein [Muribaculaceae bacterium]